ncbi:hypothetical protein A2276_06385 [candidate division WOR-1 bacterium RIFOXYA12_FULL_43_27]|nr:MAG: hypothetical protein A2276_06385 [candidate division WOR-1 bacterium RIFOXYA12_FULL_43_27]OGC20279.1 MAG: hypothetical protein A2292_04385 [candidate division WOR-1 bacterium RIFOXYB2_FULL_46_45]OGC31984.1 MAG: hypothetical protein A2232_07065 [candidate division WOR-1 bacterium RIFOXYA2_FULL_46_56]
MKHLKTIIPHFEGKKILVVGDLMLDEHIWSTVYRISPEAPVPIANVKKITHVPGGCGNVAANIKTLGGTPILLGLIGNDSSGEKLVRALKNQKISTASLIRFKERPTILKSRIIAGGQQVIRVDREEKEELPPALEKIILKKLKQAIKNCDAIILSDYGKGMLSAKICREAIKSGKPLAIDPKGSDYSKYKGAFVITPNLYEAEVAAKTKDYKAAGKILLKQTGANHIIITRGKDGLSIFSQSGKIIDVPAVPREVFDITGAGDTVIATLSLALACGAGIEESAMLGNYAASVAVSKIGTQPVYKDELEEALEEKEPAGKKIKSRNELAKIVRRLKSQGANIVFTNGCFDILHLGHARYLREAKKLGDILIVGLNSDSSVKKLKGNSRPYVTELERAEVLASLECVDYVTIFGESRPDNLLKLLKPKVHVKGGDYKMEHLPEAKLVKALGGKVVIIPPVAGRSTTNIVEKIRSERCD